jgi:hypothetical protein
MEIIINTKCPECGEKIQIHGTLFEGKFLNDSDFLNKSYELARHSSLNAMKKQSCLDGIYSLDTKEKKNPKSIEYGVTSLNTYFNDLFFNVKTAKTAKELVKIKSQLEKTKIGIAKDLVKTFDRNKKKLTIILDKRLKEVNKS